jgi:hypothetical protein
MKTEPLSEDTKTISNAEYNAIVLNLPVPENLPTAQDLEPNVIPLKKNKVDFGLGI